LAPGSRFGDAGKWWSRDRHWRKRISCMVWGRRKENLEVGNLKGWNHIAKQDLSKFQVSDTQDEGVESITKQAQRHRRKRIEGQGGWSPRKRQKTDPWWFWWVVYQLCTLLSRQTIWPSYIIVMGSGMWRITSRGNTDGDMHRDQVTSHDRNEKDRDHKKILGAWAALRPYYRCPHHCCEQAWGIAVCSLPLPSPANHKSNHPLNAWHQKCQRKTTRL